MQLACRRGSSRRRADVLVVEDGLYSEREQCAVESAEESRKSTVLQVQCPSALLRFPSISNGISSTYANIRHINGRPYYIDAGSRLVCLWITPSIRIKAIKMGLER